MKGIILAGGSGTRLYPITLAISKQLMPIYDKPMIYYPMSTLMTAGIRDILIITTERDKPLFEDLLKDGKHLGCSFSYAVQKEPKGLAEAFIIGEKFIGKDDVCLILGDNIFYGSQLRDIIRHKEARGAIVYAYQVAYPQQYGVIAFDKKNNPISIEEKPVVPKSNYAIPGIYFYDNEVIRIAKKIRPSARGELEITAIHEAYLKKKKLSVIKMAKEIAWLDTGTFDSLSDANEFVRVIEKRQGIKIGCIEETAFREGFIDARQLKKIAKTIQKNAYGAYLLKIAEEEKEQ